MRVRKFYSKSELLLLYKSHVLSFLEYRTAAIYHAKREFLWRLDRVQSKFLADVGIDEISALLHFNLAPLATRRDIAMLGLLHRTVIGKGPPQFRVHFKVLENSRIADPRKEIKNPLVKRSILGLIAIYNMVPESLRKWKTVKDFQGGLQELLKKRAQEGREDWADTFSPRYPLDSHPFKA